MTLWNPMTLPSVFKTLYGSDPCIQIRKIQWCKIIPDVINVTPPEYQHTQLCKIDTVMVIFDTIAKILKAGHQHTCKYSFYTKRNNIAISKFCKPIHILPVSGYPFPLKGCPPSANSNPMFIIERDK